MKRAELMKRLRKIAKAKGAEMTVIEGGPHSKIWFNGEWVTTVGRHSDVPELTVRGSIKNAENWRN